MNNYECDVNVMQFTLISHPSRQASKVKHSSSGALVSWENGIEKWGEPPVNLPKFNHFTSCFQEKEAKERLSHVDMIIRIIR